MKYLVIFILVGFVIWTSVFSNALADSDPNDDYLKFSLDGFYIYADNKHITDILLYWNGESLPYGTITLDEKTNSDINIMIPKNIPRMVNIDFGSYMAVFYTDTLVVPIKEIETDCFYHLRIPVNDADEITIDSISVAAGRLKSVTADDPKCDDAYKHYFDTYEMQPPQARPVEPLVPEPEPDILEYENCGSGTTYQDGMCVVNETKVNTNSSGIWEPIIKYSVTAPLKQFNSGIPFNEIQCKENLERIQKHDGTPACVTPDTVSKLSERDWSHPCPNGRFNEQRSLCVVGSPGIGSDSTELSNTQFEEIKNDIESTGYDICDIRIENDKIIIDLHKFFKDSEPKKKIISKIPSNVNYEIIYHEGYSDYSINTMTSHECEVLENAN